MYPDDLKYNKTHQWAKAENGNAKIGITYYAQKELGDIVLAELPKAGEAATAGKSFGVVESTKSASEIFSPVSGKITDVNEEVKNNPEIINKDPYGKGWMIIVKMDNPDELKSLLSDGQYKKLVEEK